MNAAVAMQIVMAWHRRGYWLGDIKPSNFVLSVDSPVSESESTEPCCSKNISAVKYQLFVIDLESVVPVRASATEAAASVYTARYQHPGAIGVISGTADYYAVGQTLDDLLNVRWSANVYLDVFKTYRRFLSWRPECEFDCWAFAGGQEAVLAGAERCSVVSTLSEALKSTDHGVQVAACDKFLRRTGVERLCAVKVGT